MDEETEELYQPVRLMDQCLKQCVTKPFDSLIYQDEYCCDEQDNSRMDIDIVATTATTITTDAKNIPEGLEHFKLRTASFIPAKICELIFQEILKRHSEEYMHLFADTSKCKLTKIDVSLPKLGYPLQNKDLLARLFSHPLQELNLSGCDVPTPALNCLKDCGHSLKVLNLSSVPGLTDFFAIKDLKNLQKLNLSNTEIGFHASQLTDIGNLKNLMWLDLSSTKHVNDANVKELMPLSRKLAWLSLYDCESIKDEQTLLHMLQHFTRLVHLDLSKKPQPTEQPEKPRNIGPVVNDNVLTTISSLPKLISLDISGSMGLSEESLQPFAKRSERLKFFGLAFTGLSFHRNLPAQAVTGELNEDQLLNSLEVYSKREAYISIALRKLFNLSRLQDCKKVGKCLKLMLTCMRNYPNSETINIAASASVYHLSRHDHPETNDVNLRREIVEVLANSMKGLKHSLQLQKNCCFTLCNFKIPSELKFQWFPVAKALLTVLTTHKEDYLRKIAVMLFNTIVCQVKAEITGQQKRCIGKLGAVKIIIEIIAEKIERAESDQLLDTCWSSLWNMTDETPENCRHFLDDGGMEMFLKCLVLFPTSIELHRNMMGLMGNIAEVKELRLRLLTDEYMKIFLSLLSDDPSYLEVSYNAAGVLSHILSDGDEVWHIQSITREQCMNTMFTCIEKWDLQAYRNINYRSFKPILELMPLAHAPAAQHWSIWALANLTKVYPHKYCKLFEDESGLLYLDTVLAMPSAYNRTKELAVMVKENCKSHFSFR